MPDVQWSPVSPVAHGLRTGKRGAAITPAGVMLREVTGFELWLCMARRGRGPALQQAASALFGVAPPASPAIVQAKDASLIWSGPDQFLILTPPAFASRDTEFRNALKDAAAITDLSHARVLLHLSGSKCRNMLAKVCSLDLHPAEFPPGAAAATSLDHTNAVLWRDRVGAADSFNLLIFATFAETLCGALIDAAAEYGIQVEP